MRTKDKLADALRQAGAPNSMVDKALNGGYDDYESESATPLIDLVSDLRKYKLTDLVIRAMNGDFDGTKEEGEAWYQREGKNLFKGGFPK